MNDSILTSVKKILGIPEEHEEFDMDLIIHINSVFNALTQMGIGPKEGFSISDSTSVWTDFTTDGKMNMIKSYVPLKVRMIFDPPMSSQVSEAIKETLNELEFRLRSEAEWPVED